MVDQVVSGANPSPLPHRNDSNASELENLPLATSGEANPVDGFAGHPLFREAVDAYGRRAGY
jgi:hypothetical protein